MDAKGENDLPFFNGNRTTAGAVVQSLHKLKDTNNKESTFLTRSFSDQGVRIRIRKETRISSSGSSTSRSSKRRRPYDEEEEDEEEEENEDHRDNKHRDDRRCVISRPNPESRIDTKDVILPSPNDILPAPPPPPLSNRMHIHLPSPAFYSRKLPSLPSTEPLPFLKDPRDWNNLPPLSSPRISKDGYLN
ncbi:hypothetical protein EC973_006369 [Apophysomyces ossiformis]|uniref:Uncharacterized protein n=1 Tax=Apophysomyces ossiformis TaxID=679940 RepID=A0A8H7BVR1_9FUNG|nr:hypothetical protein EC973_006369 [Apophysomyces ossiformis]